jgi:hypothetical protein
VRIFRQVTFKWLVFIALPLPLLQPCQVLAQCKWRENAINHKANLRLPRVLTYLCNWTRGQTVRCLYHLPTPSSMLTLVAGMKIALHRVIFSDLQIRKNRL